jgi:hypothetical protein
MDTPLEHFVTGNGDGARALDPALHLDMPGLGLSARALWRIGREVPAAFIGGDI